MFRKITENDWELYYKYVDAFYHTDAVNAPVPVENYRVTFDEMMSRDTYVSGYIFEYESVPCGFALLSKTFSQEAGGVSITIEEIYIEPEYRSKGLATEFFEWLKRESGAMRLRLEVEDYNKGAMRRYERMGFQLLPYLQMVIDKQRVVGS